MAHIDFKNGYFYGICTWNERHIFKAAYFQYSRLRKAWITDRRDLAESIQGISWSDAAREHVAKIDALAETSFAMSYAKESAFAPIVPDRLHPRTGLPMAFFPYQAAAIEYILPRKDCLLADAPGIGKTPTAVGVFNCDLKLRQVLIICPASLKEHWRREFELWKTRPVSVGIAEASYDEKVQDGCYKNGNPKFRKITHRDVWPGTDVVIINYEILERFHDDIKSRVWDYIVCDECHALKTSESGRTLFVLGGSRKEDVEVEGKTITVTDPKTGEKINRPKTRKEWVWYNAIEANRRLFLSGTPILNRPIELWPVLHAFDPGGLGRSYKEFAYRYCDAFTDLNRGKPGVGSLNVSGASNGAELGKIMRERMMIRRLKKDVLPELPQKFRQVILLETPEIKKWVAREDEIAQQLKLYEKHMLGGEPYEIEAQTGDQIVHAAEALGLRDAFEDTGEFKAYAMKLDYAASVLGLEPPYVAILFEELAQVRRELGIAKLSGVVPWVKEFIHGSGEKLLLFAYHTDVIEGLMQKLSVFNPACIYGKVPVPKRQLQVDRFQDDEDCDLGIMQIDCAGVGFTMTRAWNVAFAEEDWVPKKKDQAEDRVCRVGQTAEKVMSFSLVANGSLDARIAQSSFAKDEGINEVMDT